ncbi:MAG: hypothetical protein ACQEVA_17025, partial [Myxococcota bacterium]
MQPSNASRASGSDAPLHLVVWLVLAATIFLTPRALQADTHDSQLGEPNDTCEYTGFLGGPFPGVP